MQQSIQPLPPTESIGDRIVRLAAAVPGLPREKKALATLMGVEYETLRKWSVNLAAPSRKRAALIAELLRQPVEVIMHGTAAPGMPSADPATALAQALRALGAALAAVDRDRRAELGDLLRQWAVYGGRDVYIDLIAELMNRGTGVPTLGAMVRPFTPEALAVARAMDSTTDPAQRSRLYAMAMAITPAPDASSAASDPASG